MSEFYKDLGEKIRRKRIRLGMTQVELSKKLGFNSPTKLWYIERGKRRISLENWFKLNEIFMLDKLIEYGGELIEYGDKWNTSGNLKELMR